MMSVRAWMPPSPTTLVSSTCRSLISGKRVKVPFCSHRNESRTGQATLARDKEKGRAGKMFRQQEYIVRESSHQRERRQAGSDRRALQDPRGQAR